MPRTYSVTVILLLLVCATASGYSAWSRSRDSDNHTLSRSSLEQIDKLFKTVETFIAELETISSQVAFPNDSKKENVKREIRTRRLAFEILRINYLRVRQTESPSAAAAFIGQSRFVVGTPSYLFEESVGLETKPYANLSRLEAIDEEFYVLATAVAKDIR